MRRQLLPALLAFVAFTVLLGVRLPARDHRASRRSRSRPGRTARSSKRDGVVVGSSLIGQSFTAPRYFHPRPSAAGDGYDGTSSSASNLGPDEPDLLEAVGERIAAYREENGLAPGHAVPVDAVTASGLGARPAHLARGRALQAARVAQGARPAARRTCSSSSTSTPTGARSASSASPASTSSS